MPLIRLETTHAFYDYDAKYVADDTRYLIPVAWTGQRKVHCRRWPCGHSMRLAPAAGDGSIS